MLQRIRISIVGLVLSVCFGGLWVYSDAYFASFLPEPPVVVIPTQKTAPDPVVPAPIDPAPIVPAPVNPPPVKPPPVIPKVNPPVNPPVSPPVKPTPPLPLLKGSLLVLAISTPEFANDDDTLKQELTELKKQFGVHLLGQELFVAKRDAEPVVWDPAKPPAVDNRPLTAVLNDAFNGIETLAKRVDAKSTGFGVFMLLKSNIDPRSLPETDRVDVPLPDKRSVHLVWLGSHSHPSRKGHLRMATWFHDNVFGLGPEWEPGAVLECVGPFLQMK